jgi:predicted nucleic acid-binding protein
MSDFRKLYWDTTCFICFLNDSAHERDRHYICEDIMQHCARGNAQIFTSSLTIAEVVRPREKFAPKPFPSWVAAVLEKFPQVEQHLRTLWDFHTERTRPTRILTPQELAGIQQLLHPERIKTIQLDDQIANEAVVLARTRGLKPMDAIHAASAIALRKRNRVEVLQHWDKDYEKIRDLIPSENPTRISPQEAFREFLKPVGK